MCTKTSRSSAFEPHRGFDALAGLLDALTSLQERSRRRHDLEELDERVLQDIGLSRSEIEAELSKPFWRG